MAGSKRWFNYEDDRGRNFAVQLDESIYETSALGFGRVQPDAIPISVTGTLPLELRYVNVNRVENNNTISNTFYVGTPLAITTLETAGTVEVDGVTWNITLPIGERRKVVPATDTEQLDGDVDDNLQALPPA